MRPDGGPRSIAQKALTNMVMEKAIDYPEQKPEFMQIQRYCLCTAQKVMNRFQENVLSK